MLEKKHVDEVGTRSVVRYSDCEKYRYTLSRTWDFSRGRIVFIGLNPSTATELKNDPTVARMIGFAKTWGFGSVCVLNLFAFRATLPSDLKLVENPVGEENDYFIKKELEEADKVVACWGGHGVFLGRGLAVRGMLSPGAGCFGLTKGGEPKHPLYLKKDLGLQLLE